MIDLTNKKIGKLTIIGISCKRRSDVSHKLAIFWKCKCECGNFKDIRGDHLRSGHTVSCGCQRKITCQTLGDKNRKYCTIEEQSMFQHYHKIKSNARQRGHSFYIPFDEFIKLSKQECYYCGRPPHDKKVYKHGKVFIVQCNGIDRIDSGGEYEISNVVSCCPTCNIAKYTMTQQEFYRWVSDLYSHLVKKRLLPS